MLASTITLLAAVALFFGSSNFSPHIFFMSLVILACYGFCNGFATARLLRLFKAGDWKVAATLSALIFSSCVILLYAVSDIIELKLHTHKAFSVWDALKYTLLWLLINVPLNALGAKRGYEKELAVDPVVSENNSPVPE
jgi:hypothetical protein